jgi:hypothetical protein
MGYHIDHCFLVEKETKHNFVCSCTQLHGRNGNRLVIDQTTIRDLVVGVDGGR